MSQAPDPTPPNSSTASTTPTPRGLYRIGGVAALLCAGMYVIALAVYVPANRAGPPPATVLEWFTVFLNQPITGLFFLGLADIVIMILWGPMALALHAALKQAHRAWALLATAFVFVGMAVYLATNTAFSMLALSREYAAAATEAQRAMLLGAGQSMLAVSEGTGQYVGMPLAWLAGVVLAVLMVRSKVFGKATAWIGIVGLGLLTASIPFAGYTTAGPVTPLVSAIIAVTYIGGGLLSLAWYILVGLRLLKLGRAESSTRSRAR
jgi:hypothetical protein